MQHVFPPTRLACDYVCLQCRHRVLAVAQNPRIFPSASVPASFRQYASSGANDDTLTERLRRKIWGAEPPGPTDPYNSHYFDEENALRAEKARRVKEQKANGGDPLTKQDSEAGQYVQATTWDGLKRLGGATGWWEKAWDKAHRFDGWGFSLGLLMVCVGV